MVFGCCCCVESLSQSFGAQMALNAEMKSVPPIILPTNQQLRPLLGAEQSPTVTALCLPAVHCMELQASVRTCM